MPKDREELKTLILEILEKHYYGRNFIEESASEDLLDLYEKNK